MLTKDVFTNASIGPSSHPRGGIEAEHRACIEPASRHHRASIELSASRHRGRGSARSHPAEGGAARGARGSSEKYDDTTPVLRPYDEPQTITDACRITHIV